LSERRKLIALFAMPVTATEYAAMAEGKVLPDYRSITLRGQRPEQVWSLRYDRIVAAAQDLITEVRALKGAVVTQATLADVSTAASQTDTLLLFAHWRGPVVVATDFRTTPSAIIDKITSSGHGCLQAFQSTLAPLRDDPNPETLAELLTEGIKDGSVLQHAPDIQRLAGPSKVIASALSRDLLDEALKSYIHPGNLVEMFDGVHTPKAIADALGPFKGEIDLGTCYSMALATYLTCCKPHGLHLVHTRDAIDPLAAYTTTQHALSLWRDSGGSYGRTRVQVDRALGKVLRKEMR
jgi:hypothetical protein